MIFNDLSAEKKVLTKSGVRSKDVWTGAKTRQNTAFRTLSTSLRGTLRLPSQGKKLESKIFAFS